MTDGTLAELLRALPAAQTLHVDVDGTPDAATPEALPGVRRVQIAAGRVSVGLDDLARDTPPVLAALAAAGVPVRHLVSGRGNPEDVFLALSGRRLRD